MRMRSREPSNVDYGSLLRDNDADTKVTSNDLRFQPTNVCLIQTFLVGKVFLWILELFEELSRGTVFALKVTQLNILLTTHILYM